MAKPIPNAQSPLEDIVEWLATMDLDATSRPYEYLAKAKSMTPQALYRLVHNQGPNYDGIDTHLITESKLYGPLTLVQKEEIYKFHQEAKTAKLAMLYMTNKQNIILAKRGEHLIVAKQPDYSTVTPITANEVYGPLSLVQKHEIHSHHQDVPARALAELYKTNHQNVRIAQKQEHHGKAQHSEAYILTQAALILNMPLATLIALKVED
tara:strand:- start:235 stop:861 length:627 start_codon:yes stop_codon:yes gene_type:complete